MSFVSGFDHQIPSAGSFNPRFTMRFAIWVADRLHEPRGEGTSGRNAAEFGHFVTSLCFSDTYEVL